MLCWDTAPLAAMHWGQALSWASRPTCIPAHLLPACSTAEWSALTLLELSPQVGSLPLQSGACRLNHFLGLFSRLNHLCRELQN